MSRHVRRRRRAGILMAVLLLLFTGLLAVLLWLLFGGRGGETPSSGRPESVASLPTGTDPTATEPTVTEPTTAPPTLSDKTDTTVTLTPMMGYEYSQDGMTWQTSNVFFGLSPATTYNFYQRVAATDTAEAGIISLVLSVTTDKSTPSVPSAPMLKSKTDTTVTLTEADGYEYSKDGTTWQASNVFTKLSPATTYQFYQRIAETDTVYASKVSAALSVTTVYLQTRTPAWNLILVNQWNWLDETYYQTLVKEYITDYSKYGKMDSRVHEALTQMINDANAEGHFGLYGAYLFRTVERSNNNWNKRVQQNLNKGYSQQEAERLAQSIQARGYTSEHNAGLAADLECTGYTGLNEDFDQSAAFAWLKENCCRYGFILRYPKEKQDITGVIYEPWHYRYVGVEAATEIMSRGICLEEYLAEKGL